MIQFVTYTKNPRSWRSPRPLRARASVKFSPSPKKVAKNGRLRTSYIVTWWMSPRHGGCWGRHTKTVIVFSLGECGDVSSRAFLEDICWDANLDKQLLY